MKNEHIIFEGDNRRKGRIGTSGLLRKKNKINNGSEEIIKGDLVLIGGERGNIAIVGSLDKELIKFLELTYTLDNDEALINNFNLNIITEPINIKSRDIIKVGVNIFEDTIFNIEYRIISILSQLLYSEYSLQYEEGLKEIRSRMINIFIYLFKNIFKESSGYKYIKELDKSSLIDDIDKGTLKMYEDIDLQTYLESDKNAIKNKYEKEINKYEPISKLRFGDVYYNTVPYIFLDIINEEGSKEDNEINFDIIGFSTGTIIRPKLKEDIIVEKVFNVFDNNLIESYEDVKLVTEIIGNPIVIRKNNNIPYIEFEKYKDLLYIVLYRLYRAYVYLLSEKDEEILNKAFKFPEIRTLSWKRMLELTSKDEENYINSRISYQEGIKDIRKGYINFINNMKSSELEDIDISWESSEGQLNNTILDKIKEDYNCLTKRIESLENRIEGLVNIIEKLIEEIPD